jgi:hypothetical protein
LAGSVEVARAAYARDLALLQIAKNGKGKGGGEADALEHLFSFRNVACLLLEKYGGPMLLHERMCHLGMPPLSVDRVN